MAAVNSNPLDFTARIATALEKVKTAIEEADRQLAHFKADNQVPAEVLAELQSKAQSGELGADMQSAASLVSSGVDTWPNLFSGKSSNSGLVSSHLDKMITENRDAIRAAVAGDPDCARPSTS
ncbi:hypothetical protein [Nocardia sp. NPDC005998]|uniref:hypothetical protein n=1 Tax=Nocardia sp. NPDC005998 TaxID=3156894 RepID=UPI0033A4CCD3